MRRCILLKNSNYLNDIEHIIPICKLAKIRWNIGKHGTCKKIEDTWMKAVSFNVSGPSSSITCRGSSTASIPSILCSPKYKRLASSKASCHISCHNMATLISSFDTSWACNIKKVNISFKTFNSGKLGTSNKLHLINKISTVLANFINNFLSCRSAQQAYWFACHQKRIHKSLNMRNRQQKVIKVFDAIIGKG